MVGIGTDMLPAFYSRSSGLPIDACIETPEQAAPIIAAAERLGMAHGFLFTVPVPEQHELAQASAEKAIQQATEEAEANGIHGKALTPYVLARVAELPEWATRSISVKPGVATFQRSVLMGMWCLSKVPGLVRP